MQDGRRISCYADSLLIILSDSFTVNRVGTPPSSYERDSLTGCVRTETHAYWARAQFGTWCTTVGLEPGRTYFVRGVDCYRNIPCRSDEFVFSFFPTEKPKMGFAPYSKDYSCLDYEVISGNNGGNVSAWTTLLYIGYDESGQSVGVYYSCKPDELQWYFFWYRADFDWP